MLRYIDLFAGCGGLSLGLERAGFELLLSIEKSDMAAETFYHNFIQPISAPSEWQNYLQFTLSKQVKSKLAVNTVKAVLEDIHSVDYLVNQPVDLVAGGPPCQGFSLAGRRIPGDARNELPWHFLAFVALTKPKAVIMENVLGINRNYKKFNEDAPFDQLRKALQGEFDLEQAIAEGNVDLNLPKGLSWNLEYEVQPVELNAMHFGVPQHRPRALLIALRRDIAEQHSFAGTDVAWKSEYGKHGDSEIPYVVPKPQTYDGQVLTVGDALIDIDDDGYVTSSNDYKDEWSYAYEMRTETDWIPPQFRGMREAPNSLPNHNLRRHSERIVERFRLYQYFHTAGISPNTINIPASSNGNKSAVRDELFERLENAPLPAISSDEEVIANSIDELIDKIIELKTKKHSQRALDWNKPSPTVMSLADDYVHPRIPRTLTVREMARFQSFPDTFEFRSKETTGSHRRRIEVPQYTQVGNAVPPKLAYSLGQHLRNLLINL